MQVSVEKLPRSQVKLKIELSPDEMKPYLEKAAFLISEKTKISGFRPGKAPYDVVKAQVGEEKILQEAIEPAVQKTFVQALDQEKLITVGSPKIDILKLAPGNPFIYQATISLLPKVELGDYKSLKIKEKKIEVSDEEVNKALENLQKMRHSEVLVDRPAKKDDKVEIDFKTFLEKMPVEHGEQKKFPLVIGEGSFIPGFEDQIIGLKAGEEKKFSLRFPKNYHDKKLADRMVDFVVKVNSVYEIKLPELNDNFARSLGNFKNLEELTTQLKDNLKQEAQNKEDQRLEEEIIENLIKNSKFDDIPEILINTEAKKMISELEENIKRQGLNFEDYLQHLKKKREDMLLDFVQPAIKRVKGALVIKEVAKAENIKVEAKEVEEEIEKVLQAYQNDPKIKEQLQTRDYKNYLRNVLASRKVLDLLKKITIEK